MRARGGGKLSKPYKNGYQIEKKKVKRWWKFACVVFYSTVQTRQGLYLPETKHEIV